MSSARTRGVGKGKGKIVVIINKQGKYKVEQWTNPVTLFGEKN